MGQATGGRFHFVLAVTLESVALDTLFEIESERAFLRWEGPVRPQEAQRVPQGVSGYLHINASRSSKIVSVLRHGVAPGAEYLADITEGPFLFEQTEYHISAESKDGRPITLRHRDPLLIERVRPVGRRQDMIAGAVNFRGDVGRSRFTLFVDGAPEVDFEIEVFPSKLDYKDDYDAMLAEVTDLLMGLALEYLRSTYRKGADYKIPNPSDLEWITLLRHLIDDLERALRRISQQPQRRLIRELGWARPECVRRVDASVRRAIDRGHGRGPQMNVPRIGCIRYQIPERRPVESLDTPEHRWLRTQLSDIRYRLVTLMRAERARRQRSSRRTQAVLTELSSMEARISRLLKLEPLEAAVGDPPSNFASLVLQGTMGYREAYSACLALRLGLKLEGGPFDLSLKDINTLYEYWCYLSVLKLLADELGTTIDPSLLFKVTSRGLQVDLKRGQKAQVSLEGTGKRHAESLTLYYNRSFSTDTGTQRPDIGLSVAINGWRHPFEIIFDAKYRVDMSPSYVERHGYAGPPEDAVNVLHRYRDAIVDRVDDIQARKLIMAAALFPLHDPERSFEQNRFYKSLHKVGIGALPFLPTEKEYVIQWLRDVLLRSGWDLADRAIGDRTRHESQQWREAAAQPALIAVLRPDVDQLSWVKEQRLYYAPMRRLGPRKLTARWVAFYQGKRARGDVGAVTHEAEVQAIDVRPRREIETPWKSRDPDELCVVYHLGPVMERHRPIEVPEGIRFFRWASRLSLSMATQARELYIETEPEWRLYQALLARGVTFDVKPGDAKVVDPNDIKGRATFVIGDRRVRYAGAAGFRVEEHGRRWTVGDVEGVTVAGLSMR